MWEYLNSYLYNQNHSIELVIDFKAFGYIQQYGLELNESYPYTAHDVSNQRNSLPEMFLGMITYFKLYI